MLKKLLLVGGALVLGGVLFAGTQARHYVSTGWGWVSESVQETIPVEFEIDRARQMVKDLVPEIRKNMQVIAREEVSVQQLEEQIRAAEEKLVKDRTDLGKLKNDLSSGQETFHYGGRTYTVSQVKSDLANRFERFKTADATVASLREILTAREKSLHAAQAKLEAMLAAKRQLEVEVENLDARLKMVEVAQTTNCQHFDDSHLGHVRELIADVRSRLQVAEKLAQTELNNHGIGEIPVSDNVPADIVNQVAEYLGEKSDHAKVAEASVKHQE